MKIETSGTVPGDAEKPIALGDVARTLAAHFSERPPVGYLDGKTLMRNHLVDRLSWSVLRAETTIDRMEAGGWIRFEGDPTEVPERRSRWSIASEGRSRL